MERKTSYLFNNVWTVPNLLSFIRILLVPVFIVLFLRHQLLAAVAVLAVSGLSDLFDGKIARRFNQISELGKILDPIADKLTETAIAIVLFISFFNAENKTLHLFAWVFLLYVIKELVMLIGGAAMIALGIHPGAAEIFGKVATMAFYLVMLTVMAFGPGIGAFSPDNAYAVAGLFTLPDTVMMVLVVISVLLTFTAFFSYMPETHRQVKERFSPEGKAKAKAEKEARQKEKSKKAN